MAKTKGTRRPKQDEALWDRNRKAVERFREDVALTSFYLPKKLHKAFRNHCKLIKKPMVQILEQLITDYLKAEMTVVSTTADQEKVS